MKFLCSLIFLCFVALSWAFDLPVSQNQLQHQYGKPLKVVNVADQAVTVDLKALESLLLNPLVKDRKIVVFSIVGVVKKGKSIFMDYCLRYMYANVRTIQIIFCIIYMIDFLFIRSTNL